MITNGKKPSWGGATSLIRLSWCCVGGVKQFILTSLYFINHKDYDFTLKLTTIIFCFWHFVVLFRLENCRDLCREEFQCKPPINIRGNHGFDLGSGIPQTLGYGIPRALGSGQQATGQERTSSRTCTWGFLVWQWTRVDKTFLGLWFIGVGNKVGSKIFETKQEEPIALQLPSKIKIDWWTYKKLRSTGILLQDAWSLGLGEIGPEDPNFKIKTWALGF